MAKAVKVEKQITEHLKLNGQKMSWLAKKINLSPGHLHSVLKGKAGVKRDLTEENLKKINEVLETEFKIA
jgi:Mor family transcriptional regulator